MVITILCRTGALVSKHGYHDRAKGKRDVRVYIVKGVKNSNNLGKGYVFQHETWNYAICREQKIRHKKYVFRVHSESLFLARV